ncbi:MFS transporter [Xenophilus sp. AP218F]|nr:MFS transporter [Chromobacterium sp. ASV5]OWY38898.1 MFS transporter [Xenophilus sp. AP218F]
MRALKGLRWYMIGLVTLGTILNYLARNSLSVAAPTMMVEMGMTPEQYSYVDAAFKACYTLMQPIAGLVLDVMGTKVGLAVFAIGWAVMNMCHALAGNWQMLAVFRGALGAAEAAVIPAGLKATSEWFPARERPKAVGWFNVGSSIGGMLAPPLVAWCIMIGNWELAFVVSGALSLLWVALWLRSYHAPGRHPKISAEERQYILDGQEAQHQCSNTRRASMGEIVRCRQFWGIAIPRFLAEPAWGTFNAWIPMFLFMEYGFDLKQIAMFAWMPMLFADLGCIVGGYLPAFFQKHFGANLIVSRKLVVTLGSAMMIGPGLIGLFVNPYLAIAMLCVGGFAHQALSGALITLASDVFGRNEVATANGLTGMAAWSGSTIFTLVVGGLASVIGFGPLFGMLAVFDLLGCLVVWTVLQNRPARLGLLKEEGEPALKGGA